MPLEYPSAPDGRESLLASIAFFLESLNKTNNTGFSLGRTPGAVDGIEYLLAQIGLAIKGISSTEFNQTLTVPALTGGGANLDGINHIPFIGKAAVVRVGSGATVSGYVFSLEAGNYVENTGAGQKIINVDAQPTEYSWLQIL